MDYHIQMGRSSVSFKAGDFVSDSFGWVMILGSYNNDIGTSECICAIDSNNTLYQNPNARYFFNRHASDSDKKRLIRVLAKHGYSYDSKNIRLVNEY